MASANSVECHVEVSSTERNVSEKLVPRKKCVWKFGTREKKTNKHKHKSKTLKTSTLHQIQHLPYFELFYDFPRMAFTVSLYYLMPLQMCEYDSCREIDTFYKTFVCLEEKIIGDFIEKK